MRIPSYQLRITNSGFPTPSPAEAGFVAREARISDYSRESRRAGTKPDEQGFTQIHVDFQLPSCFAKASVFAEATPDKSPDRQLEPPKPKLLGS